MREHHRPQRLTTALLMLGCLASSLAHADDTNARIAELEKQLAHSLKLIQQLSHRVVDLEAQTQQSGIEQRIESVEESVEEIEEQVGSRAVVNAFDGIQLDIGGFVHTTWTHIEGEDRQTKAFNRVNFELLVKAHITDTVSAFFAGGFLRESDDPFTDRRNPTFNSQNKTPQIISYVDWAFSDRLKVKFGRFITPHGIINIEHFPAILLDPEQPQFLRPFGGDTLFPNFSNGLQLHGKLFFDANQLQYYVYASNFVGNPEKTLTGARVAYTLGHSGVTLGANAAYGSRARGADDNIQYDLVGIDLLIDHGPILWKTELFSTEEDGPDRLGYYTQPAWRINDQWLLFYRYDFLDDADDSAGNSIENVFGFNYTPMPNMRLRGTYTLKHFERGTDRFGVAASSANANSLQFSGTFSF